MSHDGSAPQKISRSEKKFSGGKKLFPVKNQINDAKEGCQHDKQQFSLHN
jgi:hypothetical protein